MDGLRTRYHDLLSGSYDCVDRIVLNAYFPMGHVAGGFRFWWRKLTGSDETLHNAYLMRLAGRFSRRLRAYARAHGIPFIDCAVGERKPDIAEEYLANTKITRGLFLILAGRAPAPVWEIGINYHLRRKLPMPYVNHYSFHILDPEWAHITIKISRHPPFPAQVMLNGHEYVACQARKAGISFIKEANCFLRFPSPPPWRGSQTPCPSNGLQGVCAGSASAGSTLPAFASRSTSRNSSAAGSVTSTRAIRSSTAAICCSKSADTWSRYFRR
jgi:hypothetical protein